MDKPALYAFMAQHRYGVISSISPDGTPQSAFIGFAVTPDLEIIFDTLKSSRKYPNLIARPSCSFVIGGAGEQTIQFEGTAFEPDASNLERYQQTYFAAWPDGRTRSASPNLAYIVVRPRWIRYSDFASAPPIIEELSFP